MSNFKENHCCLFERCSDFKCVTQFGQIMNTLRGAYQQISIEMLIHPMLVLTRLEAAYCQRKTK